ncbi:uncharacterized protein LOC129796547 [Lutzomyia longipalpis]|uniref:uncharacterized protein LOC129796547 n=1 Tax=Lutzomyia longipalpis TaxID=7200 RepID=UPI00248359C3|nr:uncharacterized protein LOC129796547 [Lutzomyia longipalpis]XP_055694567.1 uncharacterized protein LOC129796547 [Lutzomyia longipalpis]
MGQLLSIPQTKSDLDAEESNPETISSLKRRILVIRLRLRKMESEKKPQKKSTCPYERPTLKPEELHKPGAMQEEKPDDRSFNNNSTQICDTQSSRSAEVLSTNATSSVNGQQHRTVINVINNNMASNITVEGCNNNEASLINRLSALNFSSGAMPKESVKTKGNQEDNTRDCAQCVKKLLSTSGLKHKLCKLCRSHSCSMSNCKEGSSKPKKQNWSLKFNCAKMKSSKTSPAVASEEKGSICTCSNRKVKDATNPRPVSSPPKISQEAIQSDAPSCSTSSPASVTSTNTSNVILSQSVVFPGSHTATPGAGAILLPENAFQQLQPPTTTTTTTVLRSNGQLIQRIEHTAYYGNLPTPGPGNLLLFMNQPPQLLDFSRFNPDDYPTEDCDEQARLQREREIEEGVEAPPGFKPRPTESAGALPAAPVINPSATSMVHWSPLGSAAFQSFIQTNRGATATVAPSLYTIDDIPHHQMAIIPNQPQRIHSQVDYIHCLVPDLQEITARSFYWCKMDRYQAEKLLEGKPEGTFLLRDSAQEDFLFSVSFRKYGRSLHARIEQFNHSFSFDSHDPSVFTAKTVTGLLEHYKDPLCVMFFEPQLTIPLNRNFVFSLQQICRASIVSRVTYDNISELHLPSRLKAYLREYHYKQKVRVKRFDEYPYDGEAS